ncbi:MAG: hypothetical protein ACKO02_10770, partial [Cyanobium sp.]
MASAAVAPLVPTSPVGVLVADAVALQERLGSGNSLRQMLAGDQCAIGRQERRGLEGGGWGLEPPADL